MPGTEGRYYTQKLYPQPLNLPLFNIKLCVGRL